MKRNKSKVQCGFHPAILFDRDGTLTRDAGFSYKVKDLAWEYNAIEAIRYANKNGWRVIVVTNQSGVAKGMYTERDVDAFHRAMSDDLTKHGATIDAFYYCPYHPDGTLSDYTYANHPDRKPLPGMVRRAVVEWSLDSTRSIMIGDRISDTEAAKAAGVRGAVVRPGGLLSVVKQAIADAPESGTTANTLLMYDKAAWRKWLFEIALPRWLNEGFDSETGCFRERLSLDGSADAVGRRIRVQARQLFVYARAARHGWSGPWERGVNAALNVILRTGIRQDGGTRHSLSPDGSVLDGRRDLYDTAFVLLALAQAILALPNDRRSYAAARSLTTWLEENWRHPDGGYYEGEIVTPDIRRQNPHMHLLEAFIALYEATEDDRYRNLALAIGRLGSDRMFQPKRGSIPECFTADWTPVADQGGIIVEPGHQFEWCHLFHRLHATAGGDWRNVANALRVTGEVRGVDPATGLIFEEVSLDGRPLTTSSRLWSHAERIKANLSHLRSQKDLVAAQAVNQAQQVLMEYCNAAGPAMWLERRNSAGEFIVSPILASSFYHIIGAVEQLIVGYDR